MRRDYNKDNGSFKPKCLPDGQFVSRQCRKGLCWCVDQQGEEMDGTKGVTDCDGYGEFELLLFVFKMQAITYWNCENRSIVFIYPD